MNVLGVCHWKLFPNVSEGMLLLGHWKPFSIIVDALFPVRGEAYGSWTRQANG